MPKSRFDRPEPSPLDDRSRPGDGHDASPLLEPFFVGCQSPKGGDWATGLLARRGWLAVAGWFAAALVGLAGCAQQPTFRPGPADPDAPTEFTQTPSGLRYRILRKGKGEPPKASSTVRVHYVGKLDDGSEFDSSYRTGKPAEFSLASVVKGWTEGLQLVQPGGMIELQVPPELGYGRQGVPGAIPPGATLNFKVELIEIL